MSQAKKLENLLSQLKQSAQKRKQETGGFLGLKKTPASTRAGSIKIQKSSEKSEEKPKIQAKVSKKGGAPSHLGIGHSAGQGGCACGGAKAVASAKPRKSMLEERAKKESQMSGGGFMGTKSDPFGQNWGDVGYQNRTEGMGDNWSTSKVKPQHKGAGGADCHSLKTGGRSTGGRATHGGSKKSNPWLDHVAKVRKQLAGQGLGQSEIVKRAKASYKR